MTAGTPTRAAAEPAPSRRPRPRLGDAMVAGLVALLTLLLLVPAEGLMPGVNLDLSWHYALADATARHLPFGRDMVFTFGPLSSVYTHFFLPDQRLEFTVLKAILVVAFCCGAVAISRRPLRWGTLILPPLIANLVLVDSFFLVVPWIIVPLATDGWRDPRWKGPSLVALAAVLGPLLLVKGTLAIPLGVSIGAAALALGRRSPRLALALPCAAGVSVVVAWVAMGQHLLDLPYYLRREAYVAGGYNDAMSLFGDPGEIWIFLAGAAVLLATRFVPRRAPAWPTLAGAAILFVAFKAGFVRHDVHAQIAAGTLALLGVLMVLNRGDAASAVGLLASLTAWLAIGAHQWPVDPASSWQRFTGAIAESVGGIDRASRDPDAFRRDFEAARLGIAEAATLPPTPGTVDLYPNLQALLLAAGRDYDPRPVMQSYSAYTPELAFLNAEHLRGPQAPKTVFFAVQPIDDRFPSLDDGPSWPALAGQYRFRGFAQDYAVLDRVEGAQPATIAAPAASGSHAFGEAITVPPDLPFAWAELKFHPTLPGRVASALFKLPLLWMDVTTADGRTRSFRLVAGMANAGFLLSPVVASARDFVALRSTATDALAGQRVTSIAVRQDGTAGFWGTRFDLRIAALRIPTDAAVDDLVLGHLDDGPQARDLPVSGDCTVDSVGPTPVGAEIDAAAPIATTGRTVTVQGWGLRSGARGEDGGNLRVALTPADGRTRYAPALRQARPDVDAFFHLAKPTQAGFTAQVNLDAVHGPATLDIVQDGPTGPATCGAPIAITR